MDCARGKGSNNYLNYQEKHWKIIKYYFGALNIVSFVCCPKYFCTFAQALWKINYRTKIY